MNKKLFLGMFAAAGMLLATSCSNDELDAVQSSNEAQVTFSLAAEGGIATRAISDGKTADKLVYAVFNEVGEPLSVFDVNNDGVYEHQKTETISDIVTTPHKVTITLAKGQTYQVAFWAQNSACKAYNTADLKSVAVDYAGINNDETRDAFFKTETITVKGDEERVVELKRPFAQINVGVTKADWDAAVASGVTITDSKVVIKNAAKTINLLTGEVDGEVEAEYAFAAIPSDPDILQVDVDKDGTIQESEKYRYLSMSYILTSAERTTLESDGLQFTFKSAGKDIVFDEGLHAVPVQRNWRTNILGKLLTGDITFEVVIVPDYDDDYNLWYPESGDNSVITVTTADEITEAIKNATSDITVNFAADIKGDIIADQKADVNVVINGNGYKYTGGTIDIYGHARFAGEETLTFTNIVFEHTGDGNLDFISCNTVDSEKRYAHNVSVENCTFIGSTTADVVGMRYRQCYDISVKNCTFENMHSLMWATGTSGITLDNVTVKNSKSGVSFGTSTNISVENSNFDVITDYGIRADGSVATNLVVKNTSINARVPIIVRKATNAYNVALERDVKLNTSDVYHVVFTNGDDAEAYVTPTGAYGITGEENFNVYPLVAGAAMTASSSIQLSNVIAAGATDINLTAGTYNIPATAKNKDLTITGTGNPEDIVVTIPKSNQNASGSNIEFKGVTIKSAAANYYGIAHTSSCTFIDCIIIDKLSLYSKSVFENCTFKTSTEHCVWTYGSTDVTFKNCKFNYSDRCVNVYTEGKKTANVTFENCLFNVSTAASKGAVEINSKPYTEGVSVNFTGCTSPAYGELAFISGWDSTAGATATVNVEGTNVTVPQLAK